VTTQVGFQSPVPLDRGVKRLLDRGIANSPLEATGDEDAEHVRENRVSVKLGGLSSINPNDV
jgi:hypothetical protein